MSDLQNLIYITLIKDDRYKYFLDGLKNTLLIAVFSTIIGILIGAIVAIIKVYAKENKYIKPLEIIADLYTTIIRGTPVVVQLFIMYFIIFGSQTDGIGVAIVTFGINSGAYVSEIIRGGLLSVDRGQMEAGRSLGLTQNQTMIKIVMPQAVKTILPALGNEFIMLLKETSVAGYVGIRDLTRAQDIVSGRTLEYTFPLLLTAAIYLVMVLGLTTLLKMMERRLAKSDNH